jgi:hypothetical protein
LFHIVEWFPPRREEVLAALDEVAKSDSEPILREYAAAMGYDIAHRNFEHVAEPAFLDEP